MGIYDRDYLRDDETSAGSTRRFSAVQILIGFNILVWFVWMVGRPGENGNPELLNVMARHFMVSYAGVFEHHYYHTLITSAFSHIKLPHILSNMIGLYYFGKIVEERFGFRNLFAIYLLCGIGGSLLHVCSALFGPFSQMGPALGASSATVGLTLMAAILMPRSIWYFFGVLPVPLWVIATIYIVSDIGGILSGSTGIANFAHIGGMIVGFVVLKGDLWPFEPYGRERFIPFLRLFRGRPKLRPVERSSVPQEMPREAVAQAQRRDRPLSAANADASASETARVDAQTAARVDALLAKISRDGLDALTPEERAFLKESSPKYKRD